MAIRVQGPNGEIVEFPDNMSTDDIIGVMRKHFGGPTQPAYSQKQRAIDAQADPDKIIANAQTQANANDYVGGIAREVTQGSGFDLGDEALASARHYINGENYDTALADERKRLGDFEKAHPYIAGVTQFASSIPSALALPGGEVMEAAGFIPGAVNTGANAAAISAAHGFGEGEGDVYSRLANALKSGATGAVEGAALGGPIGKIAENYAVPRVFTNAATTKDHVVSASRSSGVDLPEFLASDSPTVRSLAGALSQQPLTGGILRNSVARSSRQMGDFADELADAASPQGLASSAIDPTSAANIAGNAIKDSFDNWINGVSRNAKAQAYGQVDALVRPMFESPLTNTARVAKDLLDRDNLSAITVNNEAVKMVGAALNRPNGLTYDGIKGLRTYIGQMIDGDIAPQPGTPMPALKQLYGALTMDLRQSVKASARPNMQAQALQAFDDANELALNVADRTDALKKVIGRTGDTSGEAVVNRILNMASNKSGANLDVLRNARAAAGGQMWGELSSAIIQRMGRGAAPNPGSPGVTAEFSPDRFLTFWNKLSSDGKDLLFGAPSHSSYRQGLEDLATLSSRFRDLRQFQNPSGTAHAAGLTSLIGGAATGGLALPAAQIGGTAALSSLLARPAATAMVSQGGTVAQKLAAALASSGNQHTVRHGTGQALAEALQAMRQ